MLSGTGKVREVAFRIEKEGFFFVQSEYVSKDKTQKNRFIGNPILLTDFLCNLRFRLSF